MHTSIGTICPATVGVTKRGSNAHVVAAAPTTEEVEGEEPTAPEVITERKKEDQEQEGA